MRGWGITNLRSPTLSTRGNTIEVNIDQREIINPNIPIYWLAPEPYLSNKVCVISFVNYCCSSVA